MIRERPFVVLFALSLLAGGVVTCATTAATGGVPGDGIVDPDLSYSSQSADPHLVLVAEVDGDVVAIATTGINGESDWSPDGEFIAYEAPGSGPLSDSHIWVAEADGSNPIDVTASHTTPDQWQPAWSPDGVHIAFSASSAMCSHNDIWVMEADGSNAVNITNTPACDQLDNAPAWSPDGNRIFFTSTRGGNPAIWSMRPDGSDVRLVEDHGSDPAVSPDGAAIVFTRTCELWVRELDTGWSQPITAYRDIDWCAAQPDWSPIGEQIAAVAGPLVSNNEWEVYSIAADGTGQRELTNNYAREAAPAWRTRLSDAGRLADTIGIVDTATGAWHLSTWYGMWHTFYYGNPGDIPFMGDWDCDGVDTPGLFRQSDAYAYLRNTNTEGVADIRFFFGNPSDVPIAGDFNGDGCDTLSLYRPGEQRFYIINELGEDEGGLGAADYSFLFGDPGDDPVVGDWDGDGVDEVGLYRASTGFLYWRDSLTMGVADGEIFFGDPGDSFVAGDWGTVDGHDSPAVYRPSSSLIYVRFTLTQGNADRAITWWGNPESAAPVAGRFR